MEVGDEVGQVRTPLPERVDDVVHLPAAARHPDGPQARPQMAGRGQRVRVGGRLHQDAVTGFDQQLHQQRDRVLGAVGDEDLLGRGGQAALDVAAGDRVAQLREPEQGVALPADVRGELVDRQPGGRLDALDGRQGRHAQVDVLGDGHERRPGAGPVSGSAVQLPAPWRLSR